MKQLLVAARTLASLGARNLWRVATYRFAVRTGLGSVRRIRAGLPRGPYFGPSRRVGGSPLPSNAWMSDASYFGWYRVPLARDFPDWHLNPLSGARVSHPDRPWWQIADFDPAVGDIKTVWEASRFDWTLAMAERACAGHPGELDRLNAWIQDWCRGNPAYSGPNWKCGQEASIRVIHLAATALLLGQQRDTEPALLGLVHAHLARIAPTLSYALAQDNNHGTSEAAALFIGGSWLAENAAGGAKADAERWARNGRKWIEERVDRLVADDGSFSQYSVVYHRVLLDTLSVAEVWRRALNLPEFSSRFRARARSAATWLRAFAQASNGDAPNIGANDGARILPLTDSGFRDFRPSVQLACALFADARAYASTGPWDVASAWLGIALPDDVLPVDDGRLFDRGGFAFRPRQADALHLDLWVHGRNILRDAGTFSYNTEPLWASYFPGTAAHNTVEFDGRDQMPRVGRFLFGDWLQTSARSDIDEAGEQSRFCVCYRDRQGAMHDRSVVLGRGRLAVEDKVSDFSERAILRWRLEPGAWHLQGATVTNGQFRLTVAADVDVHRIALEQGWESRYYLNREPVPMLETEIRAPGILRTELSWAP